MRRLQTCATGNAGYKPMPPETQVANPRCRRRRLQTCATGGKSRIRRTYHRHWEWSLCPSFPRKRESIFILIAGETVRADTFQRQERKAHTVGGGQAPALRRTKPVKPSSPRRACFDLTDEPDPYTGLRRYRPDSGRKSIFPLSGSEAAATGIPYRSTRHLKPLPPQMCIPQTHSRRDDRTR